MSADAACDTPLILGIHQGGGDRMSGVVWRIRADRSLWSRLGVGDVGELGGLRGETKIISNLSQFWG
jgi:hypothetical protein